MKNTGRPTSWVNLWNTTIWEPSLVETMKKKRMTNTWYVCTMVEINGTNKGKPITKGTWAEADEQYWQRNKGSPNNTIVLRWFIMRKWWLCWLPQGWRTTKGHTPPTTTPSENEWCRRQAIRPPFQQPNGRHIAHNRSSIKHMIITLINALFTCSTCCHQLVPAYLTASLLFDQLLLRMDCPSIASWCPLQLPQTIRRH